ncbi:MAG: family N-acetyltransferase [Nocardioides sp.]|jgi:RimJ/RimL family protein N-acetyltransferase|uniref:GNAT family N-acetyltransferase n=1 Tax=Nocardioides sp. TaxID=35761 RepID=UPI00261936BE|nr:GNAT family protein [Nocardioides sp.]MCW2832551.1 family N-acetyltransferase [Nocardioides sp.]
MDDLTGVPDWGRFSWPRTTERLSLRPATPDDAAAMFGYRSLEQVSRWMTQLPTDLESWQTHFEERSPYALMICRDDEVIGDLFLKTEDAWAQGEVRDRARDVFAEIGWALDPAHAGGGYATEAVRELLAIAFDGLGLRRVTANCFADNEPSWRLMERVGMRREAHNVADTLHRDGQWYDGLVYALLAEEWRAG